MGGIMSVKRDITRKHASIIRQFKATKNPRIRYASFGAYIGALRGKTGRLSS